MKRIEAIIHQLREAVMSGPAITDTVRRRSVARRAGAPADAAPSVHGLPDALRAYLDKVAHVPYRITDEQFEALRGSDVSDDELFELTVAAALSAGLARYERGMAALRGGR
ncbi:MAG: hypothetical protein AAGF11_43945 [Myxococcota bacterium]